MKIMTFIWWTLLSVTAFANPKVLRWGADSEGGVPYVFQDPRNPAKLMGFEYDLVEALGKRMGMQTEFVQNSWDGLIPGLNRGNYDIAINGIEITEDRKEKVIFSDPYYVTHQVITVRATNTNIQSFSDLVGKSVGTLKFSLAQRMLEAKGGIDIHSYEGESNAYQDLLNQRLDAVFIDAPIGVYRGKPNRLLKVLPEAIGRMTYGIAIQKSEVTLATQVNQALQVMKQNGELRDIFERWNLWNAMMEKEFGPGPSEKIATYHATRYQEYLDVMGLQRTWKDYLRQYAGYIPLLAKGALMTLLISVAAMALAVILGLCLTLVRLYTTKPFAILARTYVELIRGTPLLIQLYFIFYGLPNIGIRLDPFVAAVLGLGLNYAASEAENYRAGLQSIPKGQSEASYALGMSHWQTLRYIVIPQSMRLVIPPITNDFIALLKDSSLVSVITMVELTKIYGQLANTYYDYFGLGLLVAAMYFLIGLPFVNIAQYFEKKLRHERA